MTDQPTTDQPAATAPVPRTEERMARAMSHVRLAMLPLAAIPLLARPRRRVLATALIAAAVAETTWVQRRVRQRATLQDRALVWADVGFCAAFNLLVADIDPGESRRVRNAVVSYSLASAGFSGFGLGPSAEGASAVAALAGTWAARAPARDLKLLSDALGHVLWYGTTILAGREFRAMARQIVQAQEETARLQAEASDREREADVAREREITHREIHEHLLPIVDAVAAGGPVNEGVTRLAGREADRARRLLMDGRLDARPGFEAVLADIRDTFVDAGLRVSATLRVLSDPPGEVADALATATREALTNAAKYAGERRDVTLFAESTETGVEVVVRDRGGGFDVDTVRHGGGMAETFGAVRRRGGTVDIQSSPGSGTKVTIRWLPTRAD
jgi:anti-sigma regulatory factor (Ser/Thr protein kinase)